MKKITFVLLMIFGYCQMNAQILYDNGPIDDNPNYTIEGRKWNYNNLKYFFENGTTDITGTEEKNAIIQAMQVWASVTSLTFTEVTNAASADIVIKWATGDHGDGANFDSVDGILAHAFYPPPNSGAFAGDLHFDDAETWSVNYQSSFLQPIDLVTVAIHELGHSLGLKHSTVPGAIMNAYYYGSQRTLSTDDIQGIGVLYPITYTLYGANPVCGAPSQSFVGITPAPPAGSTIMWSTSSNLMVSSTLPPNTGNTSQVLIQNTLAPGVYQTGTVTATINGVAISRTLDLGQKPFNFYAQKTSPSIFIEYCDQSYHYISIDVTNTDTTRPYSYSFGNFATGISNPGVTYTQINPNRFLFKIPLNKIPSGSNPVVVFSISTTSACSTTPNVVYGQVAVIGSCYGSMSAKTQAETSLSASERNYIVYPNPTGGILNIALNNTNFKTAKDKMTATLYDLNGQPQDEVIIRDNKATVDVSKFKKGIYILKIDLNGNFESHQIIVK